MYVADTMERFVDYGGNHRIQKFDTNGSFIMKWGSFGSGVGQFQFPISVAVDTSDYVYVLDIYRVQKFDTNGNFMTRWGSRGSDDGQFWDPPALLLTLLLVMCM